MASLDRFSLVRHDDGFSLLDMMTGRESWFGPGIAAVVDGEGKTVAATRSDFIEILESLLNADEPRTLEEYFNQQKEEAASNSARNPSLRVKPWIRLQSSSYNPILEFRQAEDGSIQRRQFKPEEEQLIGSENHWETLSRSEVLHYLNYGGIVGIWLDDLQDQGLIRTRGEKRARAMAGR